MVGASAAVRRAAGRLVRAQDPAPRPADRPARLDRRPGRRRGARPRGRVGGGRGGAAAAEPVPGLPHLHQQVEQSVILKRLNTTVSPRTILRAFARVDPFPQVNGLATPNAPIPAHVLAPASVALLRHSVVRVRTTACGLGIEGSGWVARAAPRDHRGARRGRRARDHRQRPRRLSARRQPARRHRRPARSGALCRAAAGREPEAGRPGRHPRLPGERAVRRRSRAGSA